MIRKQMFYNFLMKGIRAEAETGWMIGAGGGACPDT